MSIIKVTHGEQMQKLYIEVAPGIEITMYRENAHMLYRELGYVLQAIDELPIADNSVDRASSNSDLMQLLCDVRNFLNSSDCPVTSVSIDIEQKVNAILAQQH